MTAFMSDLKTLTSAQLRRAADLKDSISRLERKLFHVLHFSPNSNSPPKKLKLSESAKAKISAAQKARWAKVKGKPVAKPVAKKKRTLSAAARNKISAAAKVRWAKAKAAGKKSL
jgi:hypothetical protein